MNKILVYPVFLICFFVELFSGKINAQSSSEAAAYLNLISTQYGKIQNETWDYTSSVAHSRSARTVEIKRTDLLKTIGKSVQVVKSMDSFDNDFSLRDSVVSFLTLYFNVLNNDFAKVIDMEEVAEQSYDLMEAYLLAQEKANNKLELASVMMEAQYKGFAAKYNVALVESEDEITKKLKKSSEALKYYDQVYLVFFKAYKQEIYLLDALERKDISSVEQNRNALLAFAQEGLPKLVQLSHFKGDNSINTSCKNLLVFYKDEAENKINILTDFMVKSKEYDELSALFKSKDRMLLTNEEITNYNKAVDEYNKGINKFNSTNNYLNTRRSSSLDMWNNSVESFMNRQVPKK